MAGKVDQSADAWQVDAETRTMLYHGLTVNQLAVAFELSPQVVARRLVEVAPAGRRGRFSIYKMKDAAPHLCEPTGDIEDKIKRMNHRDLPPMLLKEFWTGQRARLAFERESGQLWPTEQVIETFADALKAVRMSLLMTTDTIEREETLSESQRERIQQIIDASLEDIYARLVRRFSNSGGAAQTEPSAGPPPDFDIDAGDEDEL